MIKHVKYIIKRQNDGSFVIVQKNLNTRGLTIHSTYDTYGEAAVELANLQTFPSQEELLIYFNNTKNKIK